VTTFSHTIASPSPLGVRETALFSVSMGEQAVSGEFVNWLIPCKLRKRRLLQASDLYRGFESLSLRHAVWTAEKVLPLPPEIRETCPFFAILACQSGLERTHCLAAKAVTVLAFLWRAHSQSGFKEGIRRMQCDQTPGIRPQPVDFCPYRVNHAQCLVCRASYLPIKANLALQENRGSDSWFQ
jgi:hypothetical protein